MQERLCIASSTQHDPHHPAAGKVISRQAVSRIAVALQAKAEQDHGIYSKGAINAVYEGNVIAGWMAAAAGGALKIDGSQHVQFLNNRMATSGVLMYSNFNANDPIPLQVSGTERKRGL